MACHSSAYLGRPGISSTFVAVRKLYFWRKLPADVAKFTYSCHLSQVQIQYCKSSGVYEYYNCNESEPHFGSGRGRIFSGQGQAKYFLFCFNVLSRLLRVFPLRRITAQSVRNCLINLFCQIVFYKFVLSYNATSFSGRLWYSTLLRAKKVHITHFRPQGNSSETGIFKSKKYWRCFVVSTGIGQSISDRFNGRKFRM